MKQATIGRHTAMGAMLSMQACYDRDRRAHGDGGGGEGGGGFGGLRHTAISTLVRGRVMPEAG